MAQGIPSLIIDLGHMKGGDSDRVSVSGALVFSMYNLLTFSQRVSHIGDTSPFNLSSLKHGKTPLTAISSGETLSSVSVYYVSGDSYLTTPLMITLAKQGGGYDHYYRNGTGWTKDARQSELTGGSLRAKLDELMEEYFPPDGISKRTLYIVWGISLPFIVYGLFELYATWARPSISPISKLVNRLKRGKTNL